MTKNWVEHYQLEKFGLARKAMVVIVYEVIGGNAEFRQSFMILIPMLGHPGLITALLLERAILSCDGSPVIVVELMRLSCQRQPTPVAT